MRFYPVCVRVLFETLVAQRSRNPAVNTGLSTKKVVNVSHCQRRPLGKGWPAQYWFKLSSQSSPTESRPVIWLTSGPVNSKQKSSWLETGMNVVGRLSAFQTSQSVANQQWSKASELWSWSTVAPISGSDWKWPSVEAKNKQMKWWAVSVRSNHFSWHWV